MGSPTEIKRKEEVREESNEVIRGTSQGVIKVRSIKRKEAKREDESITVGAAACS